MFTVEFDYIFSLMIITSLKKDNLCPKTFTTPREQHIQTDKKVTCVMRVGGGGDAGMGLQGRGCKYWRKGKE